MSNKRNIFPFVGEQNHPSLLAISLPNESKKALQYHHFSGLFLVCQNFSKRLLFVL
jgi:hypothetical protein